jgi:hypothetical protein
LRPEVTLPVSLSITPAGNLSVTTRELDYGEVVITDPVPAVRVLGITNSGCDPNLLTIANVQSNRPEFYVLQNTMVLEPGQTWNLQVFFDPDHLRDYFGRLSIESDDPDRPLEVIDMIGVGIAVPNGKAGDEDSVSGLDLTAAGPYGAPNPFNPMTRIRFRLPQAGRVEIRIFDLRGALVRRLDGGVMPAGPGSLAWDGRETGGAIVASGAYFGRLLFDGRPVGTTLSLTLIR